MAFQRLRQARFLQFGVALDPILLAEPLQAGHWLLQERTAAEKDLSFAQRFRLATQCSRFAITPHGTYATNLRLACSALSVKGAIVECGTWKGGMIAGIAMLFGGRRSYYLYDSFEGLPPVQPIDGKAANEWQNNTESEIYFDNCTASELHAAKAMSLTGVRDVTLVKGWFEDTLPRAAFPNGIAVLRMDADWYKSTLEILESLFSSVNDGGLIIIDDYFAWEGCSKAVHDYLSKNSRSERIESHLGVCFIRKRVNS